MVVMKMMMMMMRMMMMMMMMMVVVMMMMVIRMMMIVVVVMIAKQLRQFGSSNTLAKLSFVILKLPNCRTTIWPYFCKIWGAILSYDNLARVKMHKNGQIVVRQFGS